MEHGAQAHGLKAEEHCTLVSIKRLLRPEDHWLFPILYIILRTYLPARNHKFPRLPVDSSPLRCLSAWAAQKPPLRHQKQRRSESCLRTAYPSQKHIVREKPIRKCGTSEMSLQPEKAWRKLE